MSREPELRFPEFTEPWREVKLGDVATFLKGKGISKNEEDPNGIPCVRYGQLYTEYGELIKNTSCKTTPKDGLVYGKKNDLLIPSSGETAIDIATASCIVTDSKIAIGGDLNIIRTHNNGIFLAYYLNSVKKLDIAKIAQGVSVIHLYSSHLKHLKLMLPSLPEQQKIADFLTAIDEKIEIQTQKIDRLETYKRGVMQKLLGGEIRFPGFTEPWREVKFGDIAKISSEKVNPKILPDNTKCIELEHIESNTGRLLGYTNAKQQSSTKNVFKKGDILYGKLRPYLNKYLLPNFSGVCSTEIWVLKSTNINNIFLYYLIQSKKFGKIANITSGTKMPRADWSHIKNILFMIPPFPEQQKIADFLTAVDEKIELEKECLEHLQTYKKGLLQKMFI